MSREKIGKVALTPKGEYNSNTKYEALDVIRYNGKSYIVLSEVQGVTPTDGECYQLLVQDGYTPQRGADYWTDADIISVVADVTNQSKANIDEAAEAKKNSVLSSIPDDYTALVTKVNETSNALKGNASGEIIRVDDVSPVEHTMKVKLSSKNVIPYPYTNTTLTHNGITFTDNGDGSLTVDGTAEGDATFRVLYDTVNKPQIFKGGVTYYNNIPNSYISYNDEQGVLKYEIRKTFTWDDRYKLGSITIRINAGVTINNETWYPQIEQGTSPTSYTPCVNDLTSVTVKTAGKNVLDTNSAHMFGNYSEKYATNWIYEKTNSGFKFVATNAFEAGSIRCGYQCLPIQKLKGKTITMSFNRYSEADDTNTVTCAMVSAADNALVDEYTYMGGPLANGKIYKELKLSSAVNGYFTTTFTIPEDETRKNLFVVFYCGNGAVLSQDCVVEYANIQVEINDSATGYESYKGTIYTPNADNVVTVKSIAPTMTTFSDTDGVNIEVEYNKDINKAFLQLQNAIISLGGNV